MTDVTEATGALVAIANTLDRIEGLLRPLPDEVAEANVRGLRGDLTPPGRSIFVLPSLDEEGTLDLRLFRVAVAELVDGWLDDDSTDGELVDRVERLVRGWVAETNA